MSDILTDAGVVAGSRDVTINGVIYTATNWQFDEDNTEITRRDKNNKVSGRKIVVNETKGSGSLQLATTSTPLPPARVPFTVPEGNVYLTKVGRQETNSGETLVPVTWSLAIGTIVTS